MSFLSPQALTVSSLHSDPHFPTIQGWLWDISSRNSPICPSVTDTMKLLVSPDLRSPSSAQEAADTLVVSNGPKGSQAEHLLCDIGQRCLMLGGPALFSGSWFVHTACLTTSGLQYDEQADYRSHMTKYNPMSQRTPMP